MTLMTILSGKNGHLVKCV